jgi:plasmid stabilization system protein ParE
LLNEAHAVQGASKIACVARSHLAASTGSRKGRAAPEVRRLPLKRHPYVIYYEVGREVVTILRILHGARRPPWQASR